MAEAQQNTDVTRVILWTIPRSVSTSFLTSMTKLPDSHVWYEPYWMAYTFSNYGRHRDDTIRLYRDSWPGAKDANTVTFGSEISGGYWAADKSYPWLKTNIESVPPNKKIVFVKDFAAGLQGQHEYVPDGFRHTFLIRHPYQVFASWDRLLNRAVEDESKRMKLTELPETVMPPGLFFKEQYELYQYVKEHYDPNPVIIDTEDLLANPEQVLKAYCKALFLPYSNDLLHWKMGSENLEQRWTVAKELILAQNIANFHKETFSSSCFGSSTSVPRREDLSREILHCSDKCMQYYEEMYANRLRL